MDTLNTRIVETTTGRELSVVASYYGPTRVGVRRLGWKKLAEASDEQTREGLKALTEVGGAEVVRQLEDVRRARREAIAASGGASPVPLPDVKPNPMGGYSLRSLLTYGVVDFDEVPVVDMAPIDDLEPELASSIAEAILRLSRPGLFETEGDVKNG